MADENKPHAPGGSLDPSNDINKNSNPEGPCPTPSTTSNEASFPSSVTTSRHSPSLDSSRQANVDCDTHSPQHGGADPSIDGSHSPSREGIDPSINGTHVPDNGGTDPDVGGSHIPDQDVSGGFDGSHVPSYEGADPSITGEHTPAEPTSDGFDGSHSPDESATTPDGIGGSHHPSPDSVNIPKTRSTSFSPSIVAIATEDAVVAPTVRFENKVNDQSPNKLSPTALLTPPRSVSGTWQQRVTEIDKAIRSQLGIITPNISNTGIPTGISRLQDDPFSFTGGAQGSRAGIAGVDLQAKMMLKTARALGKTGLALFGIEQATLHSLNTSDSKVWDPLYFVNRMTPVLHRTAPVGKPDDSSYSSSSALGRHEHKVSKDIGALSGIGDMLSKTSRLSEHKVRDYEPPFSSREVDVMIAGPHQIANRANPRYTGASSQDNSLIPHEEKEKNTGVPFVELAMRLRNRYAPEATYEHQPPYFDVNNIIDDILTGQTSLDGLPVKVIDGGNTNERRTVDVAAMFETKNVKIGMILKPEYSVDSRDKHFGTDTADRSRSKLRKSAYSNGILPMSYEGEDKGAFYSNDGNTTDQLNDDDAYVPLSFTDMRPMTSKTESGKFRTIYFRPIITALSEEFTPEYEASQYWGRVDPVMIYGSTKRTVNFTFELHAFAPEDLAVIYNKLHWLSSMVYPEYDSASAMKSGPVTRLRVGDVIRSGAVGLPGVIESLSYDYSDQIWELKKDFKVPRSIIVNCSFTVLHDTPMGRNAAGDFGSIGHVTPEGEYVSSVSNFGTKTNKGSETGEVPLQVNPGGFRNFPHNGDNE